MNKLKTYKIISSLVGEENYPYKQYEHDLSMSYKNLKERSEQINLDLSYNSYNDKLNKIKELQKDNDNILTYVNEFLYEAFEEISVKFYHEENSIVQYYNTPKRIEDVITYVNKKEDEKSNILKYVMILGFSNHFVGYFLNKKTYEANSEIYSLWYSTHVYSQIIKYHKYKYDFKNNCLKHDKGYSVYTENIIFGIKNFVITYLTDKINIEIYNNQHLDFLADLIWFKASKSYSNLREGINFLELTLKSENFKENVVDLLNDYI